MNSPREMNAPSVWAGGAEGIRTPDPHNAIVVLYQLSYDPIRSGSDTVGMALLFVKNYFLWWPGRGTRTRAGT